METGCGIGLMEMVWYHEDCSVKLVPREQLRHSPEHLEEKNKTLSHELTFKGHLRKLIEGGKKDQLDLDQQQIGSCDKYYDVTGGRVTMVVIPSHYGMLHYYPLGRH